MSSSRGIQSCARALAMRVSSTMIASKPLLYLYSCCISNTKPTCYVCWLSIGIYLSRHQIVHGRRRRLACYSYDNSNKRMALCFSSAVENEKAKTTSVGCLYVVSTPIGNLNDISSRCLETLRSVDVIAAEDTRQTRKLLQHFNIQKTQFSLHQHNSLERVPKLMDLFHRGKSVALVCDAGTPCISDPGHAIVEICHKNRIPVYPIPGACALTVALSVCGFPIPPFTFYGFLPVKGAERQHLVKEIANTRHVVALYEAPHRLIRTLNDLVQQGLSDRRILVARELTKMYEELHWSTVASAMEYFDADKVKGELVLILDRWNVSTTAEDKKKMFAAEDILKAMIKENVSSVDASKIVASLYEMPKQEFYKKAVEIKQQEMSNCTNDSSGTTDG